MDLCTGTGIIPILWRQRQTARILRVLRYRRSAEMARRSVLMNDLQDKVTIDTGDVKIRKNFIKLRHLMLLR